MSKKIIPIILLSLFFANNASAAGCSADDKTILCLEMPIWFWVIMVLISVVFLVMGILLLYKPFISKSIKLENKLAGTKTEITPASVKSIKVMGVFFILVSVWFLFVFFSSLY